jgi:hypothetical protein
MMRAPVMTRMLPKAWVLGRAALLAAVAVGVPACSSSSADDSVPDGGSPDSGGGGADALPPPMQTAACTGDPTACISGTLALKDFSGSFSAAKVELYRVFPYGQVQPVQTMALADDGTYAFSGVAPWTHYYVQGVVRFGTGSTAHAVAAVVGPLVAPVTPASPVAIAVKPVFIEALQQRQPDGTTALSWASTHVYDPSSGAELSDATVNLVANGQTYPMPFTQNVAGTQSYFVNLPIGVAGGTSFQIAVTEPKLNGGMPLSWNLVGQPATFTGAITSPTGSVPINTPVTVTWQAQPLAAYTITELFLAPLMGTPTQTYISAGAVAPDVTQETIPASSLTTAGAYLLNVEYSTATCPASADGCVYNLSTAALSFNAQ